MNERNFYSEPQDPLAQIRAAFDDVWRSGLRVVAIDKERGVITMGRSAAPMLKLRVVLGNLLRSVP